MIVRDILQKSEEELVQMLEQIKNEPVEWTPVIVSVLTLKTVDRLRLAADELRTSSARLERLTKWLIALTIVLLLFAIPPALDVFNRNSAEVTQSPLPQSSEAELFARKKECGSYRKGIEDLLAHSDDGTRDLFDEVFYSPSLNTCLYSYRSLYIDADGKPMDLKTMGQDYAVVDYLTNKEVFRANTVRSENVIESFAAVKRDLQK